MFQLYLMLTAGCLSVCAANEFYVSPTLIAQDCSSFRYTMNQYARDTSLFVGNTTITLVFLKGVHLLRYNLTISGLDLNSNIPILELQGQGALPEDKEESGCYHQPLSL